MSAARRAELAPLTRRLLDVAEKQRSTGDINPVLMQAELILRVLGGLDRARLVARQVHIIAILRSRLVAAGLATEANVNDLIEPRLVRHRKGQP
jgi:hypothetical protein